MKLQGWKSRGMVDRYRRTTEDDIAAAAQLNDAAVSSLVSKKAV